MKTSLNTLKMLRNNSLRGTVAAAGLVMLFQNCGGFASGLDYNSSKLSALSGNIFAAANQIVIIDGKCYESTPTGAQTEVPCPTPTPDLSPTPTPFPTPRPEDPEPTATPTPNPTATPVVQEPPTTIDTPFFCATGFTQNATYNLRSVGPNLKIAILPDKPFNDFANGVGEVDPNYALTASNPLTDVKPVCEYADSQTKDELLGRKFTIRNLKTHCPNLPPGRYTLSVVPTTQSTNYHRNLLLSQVYNAWGYNINKATPYQSDFYRVIDRSVINIETSSSGGPKVASIAASSGYPGYIPMVLLDTYGQPGCEHSISPLVVQLNKSSQIRLTAPKDGVMFDILGLLAKPVAHAKQLISWFSRDNESENYFIVLPNEKGEVNGVEEMFGDATSGPDGKYAKNGYEALRKWDGRLANGKVNARTRDGFITEADPVFTKLRFWKDENFDGIAQSRELHELSEFNVEFIDLNADASHMEVDQYGNRITLKSVVKTKDGILHVMYDLWFALHY